MLVLTAFSQIPTDLMVATKRVIVTSRSAPRVAEQLPRGFVMRLMTHDANRELHQMSRRLDTRQRSTHRMGTDLIIQHGCHTSSNCKERVSTTR